jgi:dipeptidyl-peptidase-4
MFRPFIAVCFWAAVGWAAPAKKPITIDTLMRSPGEQHNRGPVTWAPDGSRFIVSESGKLAVYDVPSGKQRDVITLSKLSEAAEKPEEPSVTDWTNRRVSESNVQWFPDGKRLLVLESGDLFVVNVGKGSFDQITRTSEAERDPKLSPDGRYVSFRRGHNLFTVEVSSKGVHQLTSNGSETTLNGELDWVYPEELDLATAHWWSPDSRLVAYLQFDISHEPVFPQVFLLKEHGVLEPERYPKAGDPNAEVRLGIVNAEGGQTRWMNLGEPRDSLLARVTWLPNSREIAAEKLTRVQNKLDLFIANTETGAARVVLHEEDPAWINVEGEPKFLPDSSRFLWTSERDGFRHIYLYGLDGQMQKQLTSGNWAVQSIAGVDAEHSRVFYLSEEDSPLERQLYVVGFDGGGKQRITQGAGTHSISFSPAASYFLDNYSSLTVVPRGTLYKADGSEVRVYRKPDEADANEYEILPTEIVTVTASDGTPLYARLIKPASFDPGKKYPAIVMVYGGPGAQAVVNQWQGVSWDQALAHKGFVVWQLDNRGSFNRGHKFESVTYHNLGAHELEDQKLGIQHLISMGFVDGQRIGMHGWSYGGYMTLYTVTHAPGLIKAAVAGAPVTSWRNYDSIYTERYMGLPQDNEEAYQTTSPQAKAGELRSKLLIVHNIEDDNVHFANTMQMADALEKANKQFFMLVYPQKSHGVSGEIRRHLWEERTQFFEKNLE